MNPEDLTPGIYRLTRDVPSPRRDKRITRDWRYTPCPQGMTFVVQTAHPRPGELELFAVRDYSTHRLFAGEPETAELVVALERVSHPTATQHLKMRWRENSADAVLNTLVADGTIALADIDAILARHDAELDAEEAAKR